MKIGTRLRAFVDNLPLRSTIAIALVVGLALPVAVSIWIGLEKGRDTLLADLGDDHALIVETLAIGMRAPIWEVRPDAGRPLIETVMLDDRVTSISVSSPLMPEFLSASTPERRRGESLVRESPVVRDGETIGSIRVEMSTGNLEAQIAQQWSQLLTTGGLQLVLGMLIVFSLLGYKVLAPLGRLVGQSRALADGILDQPFAWQRRDELGDLGRSFEETRRSLADLFTDLEKRNTELEEREAKLASQTRMLRATLDNMTDGITLVEEDLRLCAWNDRYVEMMDFPDGLVAVGVSIEDLIRFDIDRGRFQPADPKAFVEAYLAGFMPDEAYSTQVTKANGQVIQIRRRRIAEGGFVNTYTDVTEQVEARRKIDETYHLLEAVMNAVPAVLHVKDRDQRYRMVNRRFLEQWGFEWERVIGRTLDEVFDPALLVGFVDRDPEVIASRNPLPFYESTLMRRDGAMLDALTTKVPLLDDDGEVTHIVTVELDITEQVEARRRAEETLNLLEAVMDAVPAAIFVKDRDLRYQMVNRSCLEFYGLERERVIGKNLYEVFDREFVSEYDDRNPEVLATGKPVPFYESTLHPPGEAEVEILTTKVPLLDGEGNVTHIVTVDLDITERKRAERRLRESEEFYRLLVDLSPYGILLHDQVGIAFLNPAGCSILDVPGTEEAVGRRYLDFVAEDEKPIASERMRSMLEDGKTLRQTERRLITLKGREIVTVSTGVPFMRGGRRLAFVMFRDITELKQAEKERQRWLQLFQDAVESIPNGFAVYDASRRLVICNSAFAAVYGRKPKDLAGVRFADMLPRFASLARSIAGRVVDDEDDPLPVLQEESWWRKGEPTEVEFKDGRWMLIHRQPTAEGGLALVRTDVTDLKRMQQELSDSEQRFRIIAETHPVPVTIFDDENGRLIYASPGFADLIGAPLPRLIGRPLAEFCADPRGREWVAEELASVGFVRSCETRFYRADRSEVEISISAKSISYQGRRGTLISILDLTERRETEAELERHREALHHSEKMSALGSLLAGVAHELNNPLAVVVGRSIMLEDAELDSGTANAITKIRQAAERCARIVKAFLAMARQQPPSLVPVRIGDVIESSLDLVSYGLRGAGIEVVSDIPDDLPEIMADPGQLGQVFTNLLVNAQQAMSEDAGPRMVRIVARCGRRNKFHRVTVSNNGPGVPKEILSRIFEPFFTTKPAGVGTGIGLSVCYGIVEAHGGTIAANPLEEGGTAFVVTLPVEPLETPAEPPAPAETGGSDGRKVLVVDDEAEIARMLGDILAADGHAIHIAANGRDALPLLQAHQFDLVLSDLIMPDLDGPGLYAEIERKYPELLDRLIFITGDTLSPRAKGFLATAKGPTIEKPFVPDEVRRVVREVLDRVDV
jgi:PAS domain S-box-containing protein